MTIEAARDTPRLMLFLDDVEGARERLAAALGAAAIACVVVTSGSGARSDRLQELLAIGQAAGAAVLIEGDVELARRSSADGVHLRAGDGLLDRIAHARKTLGAKAIVGCDPGASRHDAMEAGEAGADYLAFGEVDLADDEVFGDGDSRLRLIAWWAEVFEIACVALDVGSPDEALDLAGAGADFIAVHVGAGLAPAAAADRVKAIAAALAMRT